MGKRSPLFNDKEKHCAICKKWLRLSLFWKRKDNISGRDPYCISCRKEYDKKYNKTAYRRKNRYGLTPFQYERLYQIQEGKCAICERKEPNKRLAVDHCHKSGKIRGLLCSGCNILLGRFNDDEAVFKKAINYLRQSVKGKSHYDQVIKEPEPPKPLPPNHKSGFIGVSWRPEKGKWRAVKKNKHIGYFDTKEEAAIALNNYKIAV